MTYTHVVVFAMTLASAAQHQMPSGTAHEQHMKEMGRQAMGFDQEATTHHFLIDERGGAVQVTAKDHSDEKTIAAVRSHLKEIERSFAAGDFQKPLMTHGEPPPGVATMQRLKGDIAYRYEEITDGGRLRMVTQNADARAAIHEFLRYQISEHKTGDPK